MRCRCNATWTMVLNKKFLYLLAGTFFLGLSEVQAQEDYNSWSGHLQITINTASLGLTGNVTNFPLLIRLNPSNFPYFSQTQNSGADIRFSETTYSSHLDYEIERWVDGGSNNDTAVIWVRVGTILQNSATQSIVMHFNRGITCYDSSKSARVFDTANGFVAVYHLKDGAGGHVNDATFNNLSAAKISGPSGPSQTNGVIGYGQNFLGSGYFK
jgi:hypothetical protein